MSTDNFFVQKEIIKSTTVISLATFFSRVLGFIRDIVIARFFGVYIYAQSFVVAFKIPNLFRDLLGEGAANSAFVPVFSEYIVKEQKKEFWRLVNVVLNYLLIILFLVTVFGIIFSPFIIKIIAPGFRSDAYKFWLTVKLNRFIFPYLLLISLGAYATAILNSLKHFSIPAFGPCLVNISIIVFALLFGENLAGLSLGVLVGGFLQLVAQVPVLYIKGFRLVLFKNFKHKGATTILKLLLPRLFSTCIYHANNFVDTIFASFTSLVGEGGVAGIYFAYRLILFPLGIFSTALNQAILPTLSKQALQYNQKDFNQTLSFGLRFIFFLLIPVSVGFMLFSRQIILSIFYGGKFDNYAVLVTSQVLFFYSIGLVSYGANKILQSCFFAFKDTLTPTKVSFFSLILNIILNSIFVVPFKLKGIALATSISSIISFLILFYILKKRLHFDIKEIIYSFIRILLASLCMGSICYFFAKLNITAQPIFRIFYLGLLILLSFLVYVIFCFIFKVSEVREILKWISKKK
ncbi:MAG: murein biosynthesis integral membrane protein MurJ [Candidatus Omnitrophica bacterium]|nr:murein biosynthesis integral membrane protein MurJ [Candidatus Omnitrophota bacterium]